MKGFPSRKFFYIHFKGGKNLDPIKNDQDSDF